MFVSDDNIAAGRIGMLGVGNIYLFRGNIHEARIDTESHNWRRSMENVIKIPMQAFTERNDKHLEISYFFLSVEF